MAYSSPIYPAKCHNCDKKAVVRVYSHRNELWGEYCKQHGDYILKMLEDEEKERFKKPE